MTSFGVRQWLKAMDALPKTITELYLLGCPTFFVDQLNMVLNFGGAGKVLTVVAPYTCPSCGVESGEMIDVLAERANLAKGGLPEKECARCGGKLEFDETPESYFAFVEQVRGLQHPAGGGPAAGVARAVHLVVGHRHREAAEDHQARPRRRDVLPDHRDDRIDVPGAAVPRRSRGRGRDRSGGGRPVRHRRPEGVEAAAEEPGRAGPDRHAGRRERGVPRGGRRDGHARAQRHGRVGARAVQLRRVRPRVPREREPRAGDLAAAVRGARLHDVRRQHGEQAAGRGADRRCRRRARPRRRRAPR